MAVVGRVDQRARLPSWRRRYWWVGGVVLGLLLPVAVYSWVFYVPSLNADRYELDVPGTNVSATVMIGDTGTVVVRRDGEPILRAYGDSVEIRDPDGAWIVAHDAMDDPVLAEFVPARLEQVFAVRLKECRAVEPLDATVLALLVGYESDRFCDYRVGRTVARFAVAVKVSRAKADDLDPEADASLVSVAEIRDVLSQWSWPDESPQV